MDGFPWGIFTAKNDYWNYGHLLVKFAAWLMGYIGFNKEFHYGIMPKTNLNSYSHPCSRLRLSIYLLLYSQESSQFQYYGIILNWVRIAA